MVKANRLLRCCFLCIAVPLMAQVPPFLESPAFGGSRLFTEEYIPSMSMQVNPSRSFYALAFSQGNQGAGKFFSSLDKFSTGDYRKITDGIQEIIGDPWGTRSRAYGVMIHEKGNTMSLTREEATSLWSIPLDMETVGFDVRRSVTEKFSLSTVGASDWFFYGGTLRIERWSHGQELLTLCYSPIDPHGGEQEAIQNLTQAKSLLDFNETPEKNITYALDAFFGFEIASSLRVIVHSDRLLARWKGDIEEKPQVRAGIQIDLGSLAKISLEADINETMRTPFPYRKRSESASLKIRANAIIAFSVGAERVTLNGHQTTRAGLNAWINGRKNSFGVGFQFGQDDTPWGTTWKFI